MSDNSNLIKNNIINGLNNISGGSTRVIETTTDFPGVGRKLNEDSGNIDEEKSNIFRSYDYLDETKTYLVPTIFIILLIGILVCSILINNWLSELEKLYEIYIPNLEQKQDITKLKNNLLICERMITGLVVCIFTILLIIIPPDFIQNMFGFYKFFNIDSFIHFSNKLQHYTKPTGPIHYYEELQGDLKIDKSEIKFIKFGEFFEKNEDWYLDYNKWYEDILEKDWISDLKKNLPENENDIEIYWLYLSHLFENTFSSDKMYTTHLKKLIHEPHITLFLRNVFFNYKSDFDKLSNHYIKQITNNNDFRELINNLYKNMKNTKVFDNKIEKPMLAQLLAVTNKNNLDIDDDLLLDDNAEPDENNSSINSIENLILSSPTKISDWYKDTDTDSADKEKFLVNIQNSYKKYIASIFKIINYRLPYDSDKAFLDINLNDLDNNMHIVCVLYLLFNLSHKDNIILNNDILYFAMTSMLYYVTYKTTIINSNTKYLLYFLLSSRSIVYLLNYNSIKFLKGNKQFNANMINNIYDSSFDNFLPINIWNYLKEYFSTIELTSSLTQNKILKEKSYFMFLQFLKSFTSYYDIIIVGILLYIITNNMLINFTLSKKLIKTFNGDKNFVDISIKRSNKFAEYIALPKNVNLNTTYKYSPIDESLFIEIMGVNIFKPDIDYVVLLIYVSVFTILLLSNKSISLPTLVSIMCNYLIIHQLNLGSYQSVASAVVFGLTSIWYIVSFILYYVEKINISEYHLSYTEQSDKKFNINSSLLLIINFIFCIVYIVYFKSDAASSAIKFFGMIQSQSGGNNKNMSNLLLYGIFMGIVYIVYNNYDKLTVKKEDKKTDLKGGSSTSTIIDTFTSSKLFYTNFSISTALSIIMIMFLTAKNYFTDNVIVNIRSELDNIEIAKLSQYIMILVIVILFYPIKYALSSDGLNNAYCFINTFLNIPKVNCKTSFSNEVSLVWLLVLIIFTCIIIYFILSNKLDFEKPSTMFTFIYIFSILFIIYTFFQSILYIFKDNIEDSEIMKQQERIKKFSNKIELKKAEIVNDPYSDEKVVNYNYTIAAEFKKIFAEETIRIIQTQLNNNYITFSGSSETIKIKNIISSIQSSNIPHIELQYADASNIITNINGMSNEKVIIYNTTLTTLLTIPLNSPLTINSKTYLNSNIIQTKLQEYKEDMLKYNSLNGYYESDNDIKLVIETYFDNMVIIISKRNVYSYHIVGKINVNPSNQDKIISTKNSTEVAYFKYDLENDKHELQFRGVKYDKKIFIQNEIVRKFTNESNTYKKIKDLVNLNTDNKLITKYNLIENILEYESISDSNTSSTNNINNRKDLLKLMISSTVLLINSYNKKQFNAVQEYHDKIMSIKILYELSQQIESINSTNNNILTFLHKLNKDLSSLNKSVYLNIIQLNPIIRQLRNYNNNNIISNNNINSQIEDLLTPN